MTDEYGGETTVILGDLKTGAAFGAILFNITVETDNRRVKPGSGLAAHGQLR